MEPYAFQSDIKITTDPFFPPKYNEPVVRADWYVLKDILAKGIILRDEQIGKPHSRANKKMILRCKEALINIT